MGARHLEIATAQGRLAVRSAEGQVVTSACRVVVGDHASIYPPILDRMSTAEAMYVDHDLSVDADCQGIGITITVSTWAIHADDVDGNEPTLTSELVSGLITSVLVAPQPAGVGTWRLVNTVTLSDGQKLERTSQLVVAETAKVGL